MAKSSIPEHLMHRIWRDAANFLIEAPRLADGSAITILHAGEFNNFRGGPDFLNARIKMGELVVEGHVELHKSANLWKEHGHDGDYRYANVVLHVLLHPEDEAPKPILGCPPIPTLALSENLQLDRRDLWERLFDEIYDRSPELPCFPHNLQLPMRFKRKVIDRFAEARLNQLVERFNADQGASAMMQSVYERLFDALGFSENRKPMQELARMLPVSLLEEVRNASAPEERTLTFEALFFGTAGLLPKPSVDFKPAVNERLLELRARWEWLNVSVRLGDQLSEADWAFFRIRPLNSPYRRIALAALLGEHIFAAGRPIAEVLAGLEELDVPLGANPFWESRTSYLSELSEPQQLLGDERARAITLNVAIPAELDMLKNSGLKRTELEHALRDRWLTSRSFSSAHYINVVRQELLESESVKTVREEQGALILTRSFCFEGRCRECPIGQRLIEKGWQPSV